MRFLNFNITDGVVEVFDYQLVPKKGGSTDPLKSLEWKPLSSITGGGPDDPNTFVDNQNLRAIEQSTDYLTPPPPQNDEIFNQDSIPDVERIMSITNFFHSIRGAPAGSVVEVDIVGHAWLDGPVIANSFSQNPAAPNLRDPKDKDCRVQTDFLENMGEDPNAASGTPIKSGGKDALKEFKAALAPNAVLRIWGCNAQGHDGQTSPEKRVLIPTYYLPYLNGDKRVRGKTVDDNLGIPFKFEQSFADSHYKEDTVFYPSKQDAADPSQLVPDTSQLTFNRKWIEVEEFIARQITTTYVFAAAEMLGIECHGTLPGMGSDYETQKRGVQKVCRDKDPPECEYGYAVFIRYYERFLGFQTDDRNYGVFDQARITAIRALAPKTP